VVVQGMDRPGILCKYTYTLTDRQKKLCHPMKKNKSSYETNANHLGSSRRVKKPFWGKKLDAPRLDRHPLFHTIGRGPRNRPGDALKAIHRVRVQSQSI
jgi:hypothetical protein